MAYIARRTRKADTRTVNWAKPPAIGTVQDSRVYPTQEAAQHEADAWNGTGDWSAEVVPAEHVNYPHEPGRLFDCSACEGGPCVCNVETDAPCVSVFCVQGDEHTEDPDTCLAPDGHWYVVSYGVARWEIHARNCNHPDHS